MTIEASKYGSRPMDDERFEYHLWNVEGLDLLSPDRDAHVELAVDSALKKLGSGWELDYINRGNVLPGPEEEKSWPQLVFRRPARFRSISESVLHRQYKGHDIRSSPLGIPNREQWRMRINITFPDSSNSDVIKEYLDQMRSYPTIKKAHEAGLDYGRRIIDKMK